MKEITNCQAIVPEYEVGTTEVLVAKISYKNYKWRGEQNLRKLVEERFNVSIPHDKCVSDSETKTLYYYKYVDYVRLVTNVTEVV